jgi:pyruvate,water dikinase
VSGGDEVLAHLDRLGFPVYAGGPLVEHGVAFSVDPRTGRRDLARIETAHGSVVVEHQLVRSRIVAATGRRDLSDEQIATLARLVARVEWALGEGQVPQRVEWAFDGQRFWIRDARPVVDLPRVGLAWAVAQPTLWSNGNLKDAVAGVPTIASWSFIAPYLRTIFNAPIAATGYRVPPGLEVLRRFDGRAYLDLTSVQAFYYEALGSPPSEAGRALGGPQVAIHVPAADARRRRRWRAARLRLTWQLLRHARRYERAIARMRSAVRAFDFDLSAVSDVELVEIARRIGDLQAEFGPIFQIGNVDAAAWTAPLEQTIERYLPGQGERLAAALMAGGGDVVSAQHGYAMLDLAAIAARDGVDPFAWQSLAPDAPFRRAMERFLEEFGHRAVYETELANPRWIEDPTFVLEQVRALATDGRHQRRDAPARRLRAEAERELRHLPPVARALARWLAGQARRSAARREAGKSALVTMALPVRRLLLEFGRRLVRAGVLATVDDVFHLARSDLEALVAGEWDGRGARELVDERRALRNARLGSAPPPDLIVCGASPQAPPAESGSVLRGLSAAAGRARGPARLVRHPTESQRLERGDILVAPSTDPGWTPLFLRSAGLVTEVGGYLSHGAIVAREYGLPAVVNVPRVLDLIADGEIIVVDGDHGLVLREHGSLGIAP